MSARISTLLAAALATACAGGDAPRVGALVPVTAHSAEPVIDVHRHASWPGDDDAPALAGALAEMDAEGIVLSLLFINEPGDVAGWLEAAPGRFIGGPAMPCSTNRRAP